MTYDPNRPANPPTEPHAMTGWTGAPQPQPPKKRHTGLIVTLAIIGTLVLMCFGGTILFIAIGNNSQNTGSSPDRTPTTASATGSVGAAAGIGTPVRDGMFEFTVTKVDYGKTKVGDQYINKTAQGQFVLVTLAVKNIGKEARLLDSGSQRAYGPNNVRYDADGTASLYANKNTETFINNINPGNQVTGVVVFDIPKDAKILILELHDSSLSGGVKVQVQ